MRRKVERSQPTLMRISPQYIAILLVGGVVLAQAEVPSNASKAILDNYLIPKYVTNFFIPPVLFDDNGSEASFNISVRQFEQQILPEGYPKTIVWGFGNPEDPSSYHYPAGAVEVTQNIETKISWINELVRDPDECKAQGRESEACNFLEHIIRNQDDIPVIKQRFHWAAPNQDCYDGTKSTDCHGATTDPYYGPTPFVVHLHGGHSAPENDGHPEGWYLPDANNIPEGYAYHGKNYDMAGEYSKGPNFNPRGRATYTYENTQPTTMLFFHDHTLGSARYNNWAMSAGLWFIRDKDNRDTYLDENDCKGKPQRLPGPAPTLGQDPNNDPAVRATIREMAIVMQEMSFWDDGSLLIESPRSGVMLVNGNTWPKLEVAPERYRFRFLNACDKQHISIYLESRSLQLNLLTTIETGDVPIYVIGSDHGLLRQVVKVRKGYATKITPCTDPDTFEEKNQTATDRGLLIGPGERYDTIVDFNGLPDGTVVTLRNSGPTNYFYDFENHYESPEAETSGSLMRFVVNYELSNPDGDQSTSPYDLSIQEQPKLEDPTIVRDLLGGWTNQNDNPELEEFKAPLYWKFFMGLDGSKGPKSEDMTLELWPDKITVNPKLGSTEIWEFWNWSVNTHPMHLHQVAFEILERGDAYTGESLGIEPWEEGMKDIVISYPFQFVRVKAHFDIPGVYVYHCHMLAHEDYEQMRPFCVGEVGVDCPEDLMAVNNTEGYHAFDPSNPKGYHNYEQPAAVPEADSSDSNEENEVIEEENGEVSMAEQREVPETADTSGCKATFLPAATVIALVLVSIFV